MHIRFSLRPDNSAVYGAKTGLAYAILRDGSFIVYGGGLPVTAGNPIYATDFTGIGLTATTGTTISNSNFTSGDKITADAWNNKWFSY